MEDINISEKKWKYTDKQFCGEVSALQIKDTDEDGTPDFDENTGAYPNLAKLVERKEQMKKDICKSECPKQFKDCQCYTPKSPTPDKPHDVFWAMVKDGFAFACPESCCTEGAGCVEPGRTESENDAPEIPEGSEEITVEESEEATSKSKTLKPEEWVAVAFAVAFGIAMIILAVVFRKKLISFFSRGSSS